MKLKSCTLYETNLKCITPFTIATESIDDCRGLVVELTGDNGIKGLGESVPDPRLTGETFDGVVAAIKDCFLPGLVQTNMWQIDAIHREILSRARYSSAQAAIDIALHDLLAKTAGVPLTDFLGGPARPVRSNYSIGITTSQAASDQAQQLARDGYRTLKLKVGGPVEDDLARVRAVRRAVGPEVKIRIDANEGWSIPQALLALKLLEPLDVELAEQPIARDQIDGFTYLRQSQTIPVAADESVHSPGDALRLLRAGAVDILNVKLMKCGGLHPAREITQMARRFGIQMMVGGMVGESRVGVTAATALASAWNYEYADLDADLLVQDPLSQSGAKVDQDYRLPPEGPGLGLEDFPVAKLKKVWSS